MLLPSYMCLFVFFDSLFFFFLRFIYLFMAMLDLHCCSGFSLGTVSRGCSVIVVHRLLIAVASLVAEQGLNSYGIGA